MQPREQEKTSGFEELINRKSDPNSDVEDNRKQAKEKELDHGLKETFPASDPVSINPGAD